MNSMMVNEPVDEERLSIDELFSNVVMLFFAGHDTTASLRCDDMKVPF